MALRKLGARIQHWAAACKRELRILYLIMRHPQTPWYAKLWLVLVLAYAFNPLDLIPDFIPVLGYLDDLLLLPVGIWIGLQLVPRHVRSECRELAAQEAQNPQSEVASWIRLAGIGVVIGAWLLVVGALAVLFVGYYRRDAGQP